MVSAVATTIDEQKANIWNGWGFRPHRNHDGYIIHAVDDTTERGYCQLIALCGFKTVDSGWLNLLDDEWNGPSCMKCRKNLIKRGLIEK